MRMHVPRLELSSEEAYALMKREGEHRLIKESDTKAHIWILGHTSNTATWFFDPEHYGGGWAEQWGASGWMATQARGWKTKEGDFFARVELIYVGEGRMNEERKKFDRLERMGSEGAVHIYTYGVPPKPGRKDRETRGYGTVAMLEATASPVDRFKLLFRGDSEYATCEESELQGLKVLMDPGHTVALFHKKDLDALKKLFRGEEQVRWTPLTLEKLEPEQLDLEPIYSDGKHKGYGYGAELVDKAMRIFKPRNPNPVEVKVLYPNKAAPLIILGRDEDEYGVVVAPRYNQ